MNTEWAIPSGLTMTLGSKLIAAAALALLAYIGVLSFLSEVRNEEDRAWVRHTYLVLETLQAVRIDIAMAETAQRDFMLTGQDRHLKLYAAAVDSVRQDMKKLAGLIADNPKQREATARLDPFIVSRLDELTEGVALRKHSGLPAGVEAVTNNAGKRMEQITAQIAEMGQTEAQLLGTRLDTAKSSTRTIKMAIVYGNALAILILLVKGFVIHSEVAKRNVAERDLTQANERLERRTVELSETNTELESFTYSVAHDLRAPLRHIAGYSNVLVQDYGPRLDAEGLRCLGKIEEGAHKMGRLVD
jgi:CHASE3 domain sensor protein